MTSPIFKLAVHRRVHGMTEEALRAMLAEMIAAKYGDDAQEINRFCRTLATESLVIART